MTETQSSTFSEGDVSGQIANEEERQIARSS